MKEIVIISGKGGTGKTSVTASLAFIAGKDAVIADCDVDAADMHLLLMPDFSKAEDFYSGKIAHINSDICTNCGNCKTVCRFDAINIIEKKHSISDLDCEGCAYCAEICPEKAIEMKDNHTGKLYISRTRLDNTLIHAELSIGAENSGKLVTKVRQEAKLKANENNTSFIIVDGSPGIGCPVIASITGADYIIMVTEPTLSGVHDLKRVYELTKKFEIPTGCIINKCDLNKQITDELKEYLTSENIDMLAELPYDDVFTEAMTVGKTIVEYDKQSIIGDELMKSWKRIKELNLN